MAEITTTTTDVSDDAPIMSSTGTPFEITGFRTEKFENHEKDSSRVDRCSESPDVMAVFQLFHDTK